ncbi:MAG: beta-N-acetylhexosaminidase [Gammaproteobacteria bacterium]|nr:beta-N-acetylhexosaminidase [Gammaproteobacteria bacterium]
MTLGPLMIGVQGLALTDIEREMLANPRVGGVILFTRNYESPEQLSQLVAEVHALRDPPLLVAVDHEGGRVQRFRRSFSELPPVRRLGEIHDQQPRVARELAEQSGWLMAVELRSVGIDFSFAPVLDMDRGISRVIGNRGFHRDPEVIATLAHDYMRGMHRAGMAATGKHFPGHGGVVEDSHVALPVDRRPLADIELEDLVPFERLIKAGIEALMIAHVIYERIDPQLAGFSPFWLQQILRTRLGFQGVIFSDDLEMAGAAVAGGVADRVQAALAAGCDMALVCQTQPAMIAALDGLPTSFVHAPASQLRLVRMRGRLPLTRGQLHADPQWQETCRRVEGYNAPGTGQLV